MKIANDSGCLEFTIYRYQFSDSSHSSEDNYNYDANWLTMQLKFIDLSGHTHIHIESCILTYELADFRDALRALRDGEIKRYDSNFMEPYLQICILVADDIFQMVIDNCNFDIEISPSEKKALPFSAVLSKIELATVLEDICELCRKYPQR